MIWIDIWADGFTETHIFMMRSVNPHVVAQMRCLGAQFIFIHSSASCHRADIVNEELGVNNIITLAYPF